MHKYKLTETVETGFLSMNNKETFGSTLNISMIFDEEPLSEEKSKFKELADHLDHCLITDVRESIQFSDRYFFIKHKVAEKGFLSAACKLLGYLIYTDKMDFQGSVKIEVHNSKETFIEKFNSKTFNDCNMIKDSFIGVRK